MLDESKVAEIVSRVLSRLQDHGVTTKDEPAPSDCWQRRPRSHADERPIQRKYKRVTGDECRVASEASPLHPFTPSPLQSVSPRLPVVPSPRLGDGLYTCVDAACAAAEKSQQEFAKLGFNFRFKIIDAIRKTALENLERWSREAVGETKMGRVEDKIIKNRLVTLKTPGPEILQKPETISGSDGLTIIRLDPWGLIASIIPCTNSTETIINNSISMLAAGNSVVFNPHPIAKKVSADCVAVLNKAIAAAGGPRELLCCLVEPTIESANSLMLHPLTKLVLVTGGGAVVDAAMKSGKRAICAGPGNPPAVVDETADLEKTARALVLGASLDNNVVCTDEKAFLAVECIADELKSLILQNNCLEVKGADIERLTNLILAPSTPPAGGGADTPVCSGMRSAGRQECLPHYHANKKFVGKNASAILKEIGMQVSDDVRLAIMDVPKDHPLVWTEQLMPVIPFVRLKNADEAIEFAAAVEGGRRHTASIHSQRLDRITKFVNTMNCSICVVNNSNYAGLAEYGEGYTSFSIATPTGEGLTTARTFSRERRLSVCGGGLQRM